MFALSPVHAPYREWLEGALAEPFSHTHAPGHDVHHVRRMIGLGPKISTILEFNPDEFCVAAWMHNMDRIPSLQESLLSIGLGTLVSNYLAKSKFSPDARARIVDAAVNHAKRDDEPGDSTLLTAIRIADKLDRMGPIGILTAAMFQGPKYPIYLGEGYLRSSGGANWQMRSVYDDFIRILEWVDMLPSDNARDLIDPTDLRAFIDYVRAFGSEVNRRFGTGDPTEADIECALGRHYRRFAL